MPLMLFRALPKGVAGGTARSPSALFQRCISALKFDPRVELQDSATSTGEDLAEIGISHGEVPYVAASPIEGISHCHAELEEGILLLLVKREALAHPECLIHMMRPAHIGQEPGRCTDPQRRTNSGERTDSEGGRIQVWSPRIDVHFARRPAERYAAAYLIRPDAEADSGWNVDTGFKNGNRIA